MKNTILNPVSVSSSVSIFSIFAFSIIFPQIFFKILSWIKDVFVVYISWVYVLIIFCLLCFCFYLVFSSYGKIRLGSLTHPKYSFFTWTAMLFSAGMGTGLLFSGVYEPLYHYFFPPEGATLKSSDLSFQLTFLHWGFSGWVVYTCMGLVLAYFCFQKNLPFRISSMMYPFLKEKIHGPVGLLIDIFSIIAILFGVSATLGRGTLQINSGLSHLFDVSISGSVQCLIIVVITIIATLSVLSGLNRGIRFLSEVNITFCFLLLSFMLFAGPTVFLINSFIEHTGMYFQNLFSNMTRTHSLGSAEWRSQWTILYLAWWIAWAPFVGLFIAKISEGRTIREFILGCLFVPTLLSFLWFTVFGGTAIEYHKENLMNLEPFIKTQYPLLTYKFLEYFPFSQWTSLITLVAVSLFFITSSDSASYVVHLMAAQKNSKMSKVYWGFLEGLLAMMIVFSGGIRSLELLVIAVSLPFTVFVCFICYGFFRELKKN